MSGTRIGFEKSKAKMIEKLGGLQQYLDYKRACASKGGSKVGIVKGFAAMTPEKRREAGRLGGSIIRRGKKTV
jgi:hypothetical protein